MTLKEIAKLAIVEDAIDWFVHDRRYHNGHFDPKTMTCQTREAYEVGDLTDTLNAEEDESVLHCKEKLKKTLEGVTRESVRRDIGNYIFKGLLNGDVNEPEFSKALSMAYAAACFFDIFSRKIVPLSDGRCAYFAPSPENQARGRTNSESWAVYCVHAVSHGGRFVKQDKSASKTKPYRERVWSPEKARSMAFIERTLKDEKCIIETDDRFPEKDGIKFLGTDAEGRPMRVVARLDEYGNVDADLTEVTVIMSGDTASKTPKEDEHVVSLRDAVEAIVQHESEHKKSTPDRMAVRPQGSLR